MNQDLQEALVLAQRAIVARLDPDEGFRPWFRITLEPQPALHHDSWDFVDMAGRYVESLAMIRQLIGRSVPEEKPLREFFLSMQEEDGLFYNREPFLADMFCQSRALLALSTWFMESGDPAILDRLRRLVHGLIAIATPTNAECEDCGLRYPANLFSQGEWIEGGLFYEAKDLWNVKPGYGGTQLEGIMKYFELSGDPAALEFVRRYLKYFLKEAVVVREDGSFEGHLHSQGIVPTMVGACMYAEATNDQDLFALCERFLRFTFGHCSSFGWVPDGIGWPTCETCAVGDVIHLACRMSRLGQGDFWGEVERIARNQLLENQFRVQISSEGSGLDDKIVGSFASWAKPNDLLGGPDLEGCCLGGGVRAIFHVLNNAAYGGEVRMPLSVDTGDIKVESYLPDEGRVVVTGPSSRVESEVPVESRTTREAVAGVEYEVEWLGDTVVRISPEGDRYPTYVRRREPSKTVFPPQTHRIRW
jgi:hypothetical protein